MGITSLEFIAFCIISIFLFYCIPIKIRWIYLLLLSIAFIVLSQNPLLILYPVITVFITWICTNSMEKEGCDPKAKKGFLALGLLANLGVLIVLKYVNLGIYTYNALTGLDTSLVRFLIPLGISFYTMSIMGYLFDVYYEIEKPEKNYFRLLLFGTYFPLLISGPIVRYGETSIQLRAQKPFDENRLTKGLLRIMWGFFKVLVISERLAIICSEDYKGIFVLLSAVCFTMRLYTNFSGSMDIVIGLSSIIGVDLPENFDKPFASETIQEFWQRWHITLGSWLRDYVLYPLLRSNTFTDLSKSLKERYGKKKAGKITTYVAMLVLWLFAGLWHGGAWKYIWGVGLLQWIYIVIGEITRPRAEAIYKRLKINTRSVFLVFFRRIRTLLLMSLALVFFSGESLRAGFKTIADIFVPSTGLPNTGLDTKNLAILIASLIVWILVSSLKKQKENENISYKIIRWILLYVLIFTVILFGSYGPGYSAAEFIYQGF